MVAFEKHRAKPLSYYDKGLMRKAWYSLTGQNFMGCLKPSYKTSVWSLMCTPTCDTLVKRLSTLFGDVHVYVFNQNANFSKMDRLDLTCGLLVKQKPNSWVAWTWCCGLATPLWQEEGSVCDQDFIKIQICLCVIETYPGSIGNMKKFAYAEQLHYWWNSLLGKLV